MFVPWQLKQFAFQICRMPCAPSGIGVISFQSTHRLLAMCQKTGKT